MKVLDLRYHKYYKEGDGEVVLRGGLNLCVLSCEVRRKEEGFLECSVFEYLENRLAGFDGGGVAAVPW